MELSENLFDGTNTDSEAILDALRNLVIPRCIELMNNDLLPKQFALHPDDPIPTNQRNLTDVRTRMGVLLEYEFAKVVNTAIGPDINEKVCLTYVISNKFPDLAFRTPSGKLGVRLEVKAIETIAEEKSANFDALIKDIRKGTDFVVVILWEWEYLEPVSDVRYPKIDAIFALDAYQLAKMRDCYWLNNPPGDVGGARQGFDLCFGINCRADSFNQEEGNYGKLMRIFNADFEKYLDPITLSGSTLQEYYSLRETTLFLGLERICIKVAQSYSDDFSFSEYRPGGFPLIVEAKREDGNLLIIGDIGMPDKTTALKIMNQSGVSEAMLLNSKYDWKVRNDDWRLIESGNKPATAIDWVTANIST